MNGMRPEAVAMLVVYVLLCLLWFYVLSVCGYVPPVGLRTSVVIRRLVLLARLVALCLLIDSLYWLVSNASRAGMLPLDVDRALRNGWAIASVKTLVLVSAFGFFMILQRMSSALQSTLQDKYFSELVDHTWVAIGILGPDGTVAIWNKGAEELFGHKRQAVLGKHIKDFLVPKSRQSEIDGVLETIRRTAQPKMDYHTERLCADGSTIFVDISISPIYEGSELRGYFGVMRKAIVQETR